MATSKFEKKKRIRKRIRNKIEGTPERPRLSVYRSNKGIYCQVIDDLAGVTLASAAYNDGSLESTGNKTEQAKSVGKLIAERALAANIHEVVFDRGGNRYHGRVRALAEGAREGGLKL
jgi:large subunit ribosomal protein L18